LKLKYKDLQDFFYNNCSSKDRNLIGLELELFCCEKNSAKRLSYDKIREILNQIVKITSGEAVYESKNIIGLHSEDYAISLEPGGQLEASFNPVETILELKTIVSKYLDTLSLIEESLDVSFLKTGVDRNNNIEDVPWMPKSRYRIMSKFLGERGELSHYMMKMSASVHIGIDYHSEKDAIEKFNKASKLSPMFFEMFSETLNTHGLTREKIWDNTDPDRTGIVPNLTSFADYIDYALDVPMIFKYENGDYTSFNTPITFREYMEVGNPTIDSWIMHLNTIFTHVRFNRSIIELRFFDSSGLLPILKAASMVKGLFYSDANDAPTIDEKGKSKKTGDSPFEEVPLNS
jgi:glutamate--cysteine ligase